MLAETTRTNTYASTLPSNAIFVNPTLQRSKSVRLDPAVQESAAREALVLEHVSLVRFVARQISSRVPQHVELDDLVSAGMVGLLDAANKFDGRKDVQFRSYAQIRVRGAILDSLRTEDWSPRELRRKGRAVGEATRVLSARLGRVPDAEEIAKEMGLELRDFQELTGDLKGLEVSSLNDDRGEASEEEELDILAAPEKENPLTLYLQGEQKQQLAAALETLPEKERLVLQLHLVEEMTLREIGLTLGVVESRVSQIRSSAVKRLRKTLCGTAAAAGSR